MSRLLLPLVIMCLVSCGKVASDKNEPVSRTSSDELSSDSFISDFKITRQYDISSITDLNNNNHVKNYLKNINFKNLEINLGQSESLDPAGCFTKDNKLASVETQHHTKSKKVKVSIFIKQSLSPVFIYCPIISVEIGYEFREFRILPDIYVNDDNKEQFLNWANEKNSFDHVIFDLKDSFFIKNRNLTIRANKFISLNYADISNFPNEEITAPDDNHGLDGGVVDIITTEAVGQLSFKFNGQHAGLVTYIPKKQTQLTPDDSSLDGKCDSRGRNCQGRVGRAWFYW